MTREGDNPASRELVSNISLSAKKSLFPALSNSDKSQLTALLTDSKAINLEEKKAYTYPVRYHGQRVITSLLTPVLEAARQDDIGAILELIEHEADATALDSHGHGIFYYLWGTSLHRAPLKQEKIGMTE